MEFKFCLRRTRVRQAFQFSKEPRDRRGAVESRGRERALLEEAADAGAAPTLICRPSPA